MEDKNVYIISIHENNKWPRTGNIQDCHIPNIVNIPVPENFNDSEMMFIIEQFVCPLALKLNPDLVIIQAGADCLEDDPQSKMCLTNFSYWNSISKLKDITKKTLILGGGGYNPYITAKAWAGNWLVLNDKEFLLDTVMNDECRDLLKTLNWKNHRVRDGIPKKWLEYSRKAMLK